MGSTGSDGTAGLVTERRQVLGGRGEDAAAAWYEAHGYEVVARNWRAGRRGEIDVIAVLGKVCAVCEVKTRSSDAFGTAAEAVTPEKQRRLRRLAAAWLAARPAGAGWVDVRFDVAAVDRHGQVEMIEAAF